MQTKSPDKNNIYRGHTPKYINLYRGYPEKEIDILNEFHQEGLSSEDGYVIDFIGTRTSIDILWKTAHGINGKVYSIPVPADFHAEAVEWIGVLKVVKSAKDKFSVLELGAGFGTWAVSSGVAARIKGITDIHIHMVEGDPRHCESAISHFDNNGFGDNKKNIIHGAVGAQDGTARWPKMGGSASSDGWDNRPELDSDGDYMGRTHDEMMDVDVISLKRLLKREEYWDLLHIDVQGHEVEIVASCLEDISKTVRWIVVGTHSRKLDGDFLEMMHNAGWTLENEKPTRFRWNRQFPTLEAMTIMDGTQVWRNPLSLWVPELAKPPEDIQLYRGYPEEEIAILNKFHQEGLSPEEGYVIDFIGTRMRTKVLWKSAQRLNGKVLPMPVPADFHTEAVEWIGILKAVKSARNIFKVLELGAGFGILAVSSGVAARIKGITDIHIHMVEGDPRHCESAKSHFEDNGFGDNKKNIINAAVGAQDGTTRWPKIGGPASSNGWDSRPQLDSDDDYMGRTHDEMMDVDVISLKRLLEREQFWDLLHIDVQGHEVEIVASCLEDISKTVRWIVVGTHSRKLDGDFLEMMHDAGWILENEKPTRFQWNSDSPIPESIKLRDGTQVWRNPKMISHTRLGRFFNVLWYPFPSIFHFLYKLGLKTYVRIYEFVMKRS